MKNLFLSLTPFISLFLISCGGGGGGGSSSPSVVTPTYNYSTVDQRIEAGTVSQFKVQGVAIAQTYNNETQNSYRKFLNLNESNISFSTGSDAYGDQFVTIEMNKRTESELDGSNTPNIYNLNYQFSFTGNDVMTLANSPNHLEVREYFTNAQLWAIGLADPKAYAGTDYVDMMIWTMFYTNEGNRRDHVAYVYGDNTFSGNMPSGTATYDVKSMGYWGNTNGTYIYEGEGSFSANFSSMKLTGTIINDYITRLNDSWRQIAGASAGGIDFEGDISGSSFDGTAVWSGTGEGTFHGEFFGPNAQEIGGDYSIFADENGYSNWIIGSFIGCSGSC